MTDELRDQIREIVNGPGTAIERMAKIRALVKPYEPQPGDFFQDDDGDLYYTLPDGRCVEIRYGPEYPDGAGPAPFTKVEM